MRQDIYLHSLHGGIKGYSSEATLELLEKILKSGAVLSTNLSGVPCNNNFSGADYISLCDYERKHLGKGFGKTYNGFYQYAVYDPSLMFPKDQIEVIHPIILKKMIIQYSNYVSFMRELGMEEDRYTDLEDEVQVRDRIDINKLCGLRSITASKSACIFLPATSTKVAKARSLASLISGPMMVIL